MVMYSRTVKIIKLSVIGLFIVLALLFGIRKGSKYQYPVYEINQNSSISTEEISYRSDDVEETEISTGDPEYDIESEAEAIARVLYGTARNNSEEGKKAVCWCVINRVESPIYPNTVEEVCSQKSQFMGYSDDNPVIESLYDIAKGVLEIWHSDGHRPMSPEYVFLTWSSKRIVLKDTFEDTKSTRYYYAD